VCSSLNIRYQVSHSYRTTGKIRISYILIHLTLKLGKIKILPCGHPLSEPLSTIRIMQSPSEALTFGMWTQGHGHGATYTLKAQHLWLRNMAMCLARSVAGLKDADHVVTNATWPCFLIVSVTDKETCRPQQAERVTNNTAIDSSSVTDRQNITQLCQ
jgi:hypothetical protein